MTHPIPTAALEQDGVNLGFPLKGRDTPSSGLESWCLTVRVGEKDGKSQVIPVAYTREQAIEIARRIATHYDVQVLSA